MSPRKIASSAPRRRAHARRATKNELRVAGAENKHAVPAPFRSLQNRDSKGEKLTSGNLRSTANRNTAREAPAAVIELEHEVEPKVFFLSEAKRRLGERSSAAE